MIVNTTSIDLNVENNIGKLLRDSVLLDIETTGFSKTFNDIISISFFVFEGCEYKIHQVFCEYIADEKEALKYFKELINNKKYIITYNGNTFDIPFINEKFNKYDLNYNLNHFIKIDLYNHLRHISKKIEINDLKLKTVERYFKINRVDTFSGEDITVLYEAFKIDPKKEFYSLILSHNYEDVFNLQFLLKYILGLYDYVIYNDNIIILINNDNIKIKNKILSCKFNAIPNMKLNHFHKSQNYSVEFDLDSQTIKIDIHTEFFKDDNIDEFYYVDNTTFILNSYVSLHSIKKNLIPLKFNGKMYYDNINKIIYKIIEEVFND